MMLRVFLVVAMAAALAACATTTPNPMSADLRNGVFVKNVTVVWDAKDGKRAGNEGYEKHKADMQARLHDDVEAAFRTSPSGSEPVTFRITVTQFSGDNLVDANVDVVRISDGKVLATYEKVEGIHVSSGGLLGLVAEAALKVDQVGMAATNFTQNLRARFDGA